MSVAVVLVSAGKGTRLGANLPKAAVSIAGKTLLEHALQNIQQFAPDQLIVVAPAGMESQFLDLAKPYFETAEVVTGGETRQDSVANGLAKVTSEHVLVHDAARALTPAAVFEAVARKLETEVSVVPVLAIPDTIKEIDGEKVIRTIDRNPLRLSQTPQGFRTSELRTALAAANASYTDEAALMESAGIKVATVPGDEIAFKITTPGDLTRAKALVADVMSGIGTDAHKFSDSGTLVLGCIDWPEYSKLEGHSDGDSIAHAIVDALLSAANLGDIGSNFGVDRPEYSGASGEVFLSATMDLLEAQDLEIVNVAVQVVADKPKIGPRRQVLQERLSGILRARVSVLATTTDGLGFLADARGVAAVATALVRKRG